MINISIPGYGDASYGSLVLDYNGTLAIDGKVIDGVMERLKTLSQSLEIHILTADTFGTVKAAFEGTGFTVSVLGKEAQDLAKQQYVVEQGAKKTIAVGNGRNDCLMLEKAALGIAVVGAECAAGVAVQAADIVAPNILCALDLLLKPLRLIATLRS
ncbi:ATPase, P-type (transporting), HAD superfamily, subfamily IC [Desulfatibacillum alkenivorans DSM 16219]|uniref:ATPase, P-type (Transporting), HAD superfamily, subfamily IC n=1 Tax=Desulfatibacillum alkenivorans DSM 16219 TaxID=1121393 RepID=A0A1M6E5I0_9BACT|nr:HAD family hydrolase [Desulfatibacillum alkenivorans]SHI80701.1 ATPase, P-type (transporting), HAD superfamily, subfamily IC [Desulfatibacillum alkenivorans DSM 16219]